MKKIFLFLVLLFAVGSWAACSPHTSWTISDGCGNDDYLIGKIVCSGSRIQAGWCGGDGKSSCKFCPDESNCSASGFSPGCGAYTIYTGCVLCSNQCEADSLRCVNAGNNWEYTGAATCGGMECKEPQPCDTTMNCIEYPFNHCEDVPSTGQIHCDVTGCTGLPYTRFWSEYRKECTNECGESETQSFMSDTLISFESTCEDSVQCSEKTKCVDFPNSGTYLLYSVCVVGNSVIGNASNNRSYPLVVGGGSGSCASINRNSTNFPNTSNGGGSPDFPDAWDSPENNPDPQNIDDDCLIYGLNCPPNFEDTTNYNDRDKRSPSACVCEPLDGLSDISTIICPDGSRTTFYGSCNDWRRAFSSSSFSSSSTENPPESSSSGSENPPASSGGITGEYPDWVRINDSQKKSNDVLGVIVQEVKAIPNKLINGFKELLGNYSYMGSGATLEFSREDSLVTLDTIVDTAGIIHAIFDRVDTNNRILDTLQTSSFTGCPCITFFGGNHSNSVSNGHITFKEMKFDLGNVHGFNLCRIISVIVVGLASVVSFFIGFAVFKNIS